MSNLTSGGNVSANWLSRLFAGVLLGGFVLPSLGYAQVDVESVSLESKLIRFPAIAIDGIHYDALKFEYVTKGQLRIASQRRLSETLDCQGAAKENVYLNIDYSGLEVLFRITDTHSRRVLLDQKLVTDGTSPFNKGQCNGGEVESTFARQQDAWLAALQRQILAGAQRQMEDYIHQDTAPSMQEYRLSLSYFNSQDIQYRAFNDAYEQAAEALATYAQFGPTVDAESELIAAVKVWENELVRVMGLAATSPSTAQVRQVFHRNLTVAYLFLNQFDLARKHDALAIHTGLDKSRSLQDDILSFERRRILSPLASRDMVLTANLYRFGQNAMRDAVLTQVDHFQPETIVSESN